VKDKCKIPPTPTPHELCRAIHKGWGVPKIIGPHPASRAHYFENVLALGHNTM